MSKLVKGFKGLREFLGVDHIDDEHDDLEHEMDEFEEKVEKPQDKKAKKTKKQQEMDELEELEFSAPMQGTKTTKAQNSQVAQEQPEENGDDCQTIFIDPKDFSECKKIAKYIKNDQMVTLNLEYLEPAKAQRMMDFLMGAMLVTGAKFIQIHKKVYTSVPKSVKVHYAGKKDLNGKVYSMEKDGDQVQF